MSTDPVGPAADGSLRLASFNLLHGMVLRTGDASDPGPLRAAAAELAADVVALQEVDVDQPRSSRVDQVAVFAGAAGLDHHVFHPTVDGTPGETWSAASRGEGPRYGIGLASRYPLTGVEVLELGRSRTGFPLLLPNGRPTMVHDEPRAAIAARVVTPVGPVTVASAHLSFVPGWNVVQLLRLTRWLARLPGPRILLGDLNMPGVVSRLAREWRPLATVPTYPAPRARIQFDHALLSGDLGAVVTGVAAHRLAVSDHCALSVTVGPAPAPD